MEAAVEGVLSGCATHCDEVDCALQPHYAHTNTHYKHNRQQVLHTNQAGGGRQQRVGQTDRQTDDSCWEGQREMAGCRPKPGEPDVV